MNRDKINKQKVTSIAKLLKNREIGLESVYRSAGRIHRPLEIQNLPLCINERIDSDCCGALKHINCLKIALERKSWLEIEATVGDIITALLDNSQNRSANDLFSVTPKKRLEREFFVLYGGVRLLFQLFASPYGEPNSRRTALYSGKHEVWNEVLVILREVAIAIPTISEKIFENSDIVFLFSLLNHQAMFDNTMNLLEEILASRDETFCLLLVPNFFSLVDSFSSRQLAHFCRVLSLVLFEPEDRQIMEGSQVLKSIDLLQLRRNRMAKNSSGIVERNQSLVIEMPQMLGRLIQLLKVLNYGPNLSDLISHNIVTQSPITSDILNFNRSHMGSTDWDHLSDLQRQAASSRSINSSPSSRKEDRSTRGNINRAITNETIANSPPVEGYVAPPRYSSTVRVPLEFSTPSRHGGSDDRHASQLDEEDDIMAELLSAFSPDQGGSDNNRFFELSVSNIVSVIQVARSLGIADLTPLGESLVITQPGMSERLRSQDGVFRGSRSRAKTPAHCKKELQFHAMMLSPYQIELLFVLCTLLSGRRKVSIQKKFADLGLAKVLREMYDRMSWGSPPYAGESFEHIHGPGCECNPESAVRVQLLRLIHNFFDRDFLGNENKLLILSTKEQEVVNDSVDGEQIKNGIARLLREDRGTLSEIICTLISEPSDSVYRFWLSACVENFLRGCGQAGQLFVAHSGVLQHITQHIVRSTPSTNNSLQTAFDLLGEMVKCNPTILELLESSFDDSEFRLFVRIVMDNLVDSNVFIRSLVLSLEMMSYDDSMDQGMTEFGFYFNALVLGSNPNIAKASNINKKTSGFESQLSKLGFLTDTWVQFQPAIQSNRAIELYKNNGKSASDGKKSQLLSQKRSVASSHMTNKKVGLPSESKNIFDADNIPYRCNLDFHEDGNLFPKIPHSQQEQIQSPQSSAKSSDGLRRPGALSAQAFSDSTHSSTKPIKSGGAFYSGMYETLKDLRKATDSFLRFGTKSPTNSTTTTNTNTTNTSASSEDRQFSTNPIKIQKISVSGGDLSSKVDKTNDDDADEFDLFKTPPEPPRFATSKSSPSRSMAIDCPLSRSADLAAPVLPSLAVPSSEQLHSVTSIENDTSLDGGDSLKDSPRFFDTNNTETTATATATNAKVFIPSSLFRFSVFLVKEKVSILLRLIGTVTIRTVNHENICCLNTTLLILLFEYKRGQLAWTLNKIRDLANAEYEGCAYNSDNEIYCGSCADREQQLPDMTSDQPLQSVCEVCNSDQTSCTCETESKSATEAEARPSGADKIMQNLRGLLWYWREYYLRRGRDRLSIEFSTHIPFRYWMELVDLLCQDNGSPMSLLEKPMYLPSSPYNRPFIGSYFTQSNENNIILL